MNDINIITNQQECGLVAYEKYCKEQDEDGCEPLNFWEWYFDWCYENGLYNDKQSC